MNTSPLLLSIIIPSYNMEEYIGNNLKKATLYGAGAFVMITTFFT